MFNTAPFLVLWYMAAASPPDVIHDPANKASAVVVVSVAASSGGMGSGAVVDARGLVVTNLHVVDLAAAKATKESEGIFVCANPVTSLWLMEPRSEALAKRLPGSLACRRAKVVGMSLTNDLALLKTEQLPWQVSMTDEVPAEADHVHVRTSLADISPPVLKLGRFVTTLDPNYYPKGDPRRAMPPHFLLDLGAISGGSGGPAFDAKGRMFGLIVAVTAYPGRSDALVIRGSTIIAFVRANDPFQPRP